MILDTLAESTKKRVEQAKKKIPLEQVRQQALSMPQADPFQFEQTLNTEGLSFICEVKRASPSKGLIAEEFPYLEIARAYENAGAGAVSVLTEPEYFKGSNDYLREIAGTIRIPVLRKDFTVDAYQIYEAKILGAGAVLLICALLRTERLAEYIHIADSLGLSALVEAHNKQEIDSALQAGARLVGVNNRDLKTFEVDIQNAVRLREHVPAHIPFVAESGIKTPQDIQLLQENGVDAVLIGETLMRSGNIAKALSDLRGGA